MNNNEDDLRGRVPRAVGDSGPVIATRDFTGHSFGDVKLQLHSPCLRGNFHVCSFDICTSEGDASFEVYGADSLHSLQLAISTAGKLLEAGNPQLRWQFAWNGCIGFPHHFPSDLPPAVQRKLDQMVAFELSAYEEGTNGEARAHFKQEMERAKREKSSTQEK